MLNWLRWRLVRLLGGLRPNEWVQVNAAHNLIRPMTSFNLSSRRLSLSHFTARTSSRLSGQGAKAVSLTLTFNGVPVHSPHELVWAKHTWGVDQPQKLAAARAAILILSDPAPGGLMSRLDPDERAVLLVARTWVTSSDRVQE